MFWIGFAIGLLCCPGLIFLVIMALPDGMKHKKRPSRRNGRSRSEFDIAPAITLKEEIKCQ